MYFFVTTLVMMVAIVTCETGNNDDQDNGNWAYQWYVGEPFTMVCNTSTLKVRQNEWIVWQTPNHGHLNSTIDNDHFKVEDRDNVKHFVLTIKKVEPVFSGVYTCHVFNSTMATRDKTTFGLNIREARLRDISDRYSYNIKVAFIATAVFLAPVLTICFVFRFRFQTDEDKLRRKQKKAGVKNYAYAKDSEYAVKDSGLPTDDTSDGRANFGYDTQL